MTETKLDINNSNILVYGVGTKGMEYPAYIRKKPLAEYTMWKRMLERCSIDYPTKYPTYTGVTCSDNFKSYSFFYQWCQEQVGFGNKDENGSSWQLDKDILIKGNKLYSENTCCFVPQSINKLTNICKSTRGDTPIGTHLVKRTGKYSAYLQREGARISLGYYNTASEAFSVYKVAKEAYVKQVAEKYKNVLDERLYQALINYKVFEND